MADSLAVVGAGGFGRETIGVIRAVNAASEDLVWNLVGVVDDSPSDLNLSRLESLGVPYVGRIEDLAEMADVAAAVGVGSPKARAAIAARLDDMNVASPNLIHPTAAVGSQFVTAPGLVACAHVSVGTNVKLGRHVHLNPHAVIGHDCMVEDFVSVNPNATISGECSIGARTLVGAGSVVLQGLALGSEAVIGASACVVQDVATGTTAKGVPAR